MGESTLEHWRNGRRIVVRVSGWECSSHRLWARQRYRGLRRSGRNPESAQRMDGRRKSKGCRKEGVTTATHDLLPSLRVHCHPDFRYPPWLGGGASREPGRYRISSSHRSFDDDTFSSQVYYCQEAGFECSEERSSRESRM